MAIFMKAEWLLLLHYSIVLMLTFHLRISTAAPTSLAPDNVKGSTAAEQSSQPIHIHHQYLREFFRCLTLRDDGADLSAAGCIPAVFSTMDSVPSDVESDTVSGYLSKDSILENGTITLSFQFAMDLPVSAVHLRIHKNKTEDSIISSIQECDLEQEGITISVNVRNPQKVGEVITLHQLNINYNELLNEKWLDFDSLSIISNYNYIHNNTMELYLKLETANKCPSLTIKDMGITLQNEYEPVIVMYMSDNSKSLQIEQQINETIINDRRKRAVEGSGIETEFCRLIDHKVSYVHLMQSSGMEGKFEMNYCSGHCIHPVGGNPPLHTKILGYLASQQEDNYNAIIPTPCCVPTRYKTLTIAKYKGYPFNHLFLRSLTNITAKECGCR